MIKEHKCTKIVSNSNMGCNECWTDGNLIFYFDYDGIVKVGDTVKIEKDEKGFNKTVWINNKQIEK